MEIKVQHFFDAAHQLVDSEDLVSKGCANLHGHTYKVVVEAHGHQLHSGMLIDFKAVKEVINKLDHTTILQEGNELIPALHEQFVTGKVPHDVITLKDLPTAENIAKYLWGELNTIFTVRNIWDLQVSVCEGFKGESSSNWIMYSGDKGHFSGSGTLSSIATAPSTFTSSIKIK